MGANLNRVFPWLLGVLLLVSEVAMGAGCSKLEWSSNPGAYEAQLFRRCENPYFPQSQRIVSKKDLAEAKQIDHDDYLLAKSRLAQLGPLPSSTSISELLNVRERCVDLIFFSMGVGGQAYKIAALADKMREAVLSDMRAAFSNDAKALASIEKADAFHKSNIRKFFIPVIAQMVRERSPIKGEHSIATILSEDPRTIAFYLSLLPEDTQALFKLEALTMMKDALNEGYIDPQFEEKLSILTGGDK